MFRLWEDHAVINRYGLNSEGHEAVAERLAKRDKSKGWVGVNLAKNSIPNSGDFAEDYVAGVKTLGPVSDFIVLNVSCPNVAYTKTVKDDEMRQLVREVKKARDEYCVDVPLFMKVSPDLTQDGRKNIAAVAIEFGLDGLVVSNTTSTRPASLKSENKKEQGGLSGDPIKLMALESVRELYRLTDGAVPIIGVGGISSGQDAYDRLRAGASLIQVYTALAYQGPGLILRIQEELRVLLKRDGFASVQDCIGIDVPEVSRNN